MYRGGGAARARGGVSGLFCPVSPAFSRKCRGHPMTDSRHLPVFCRVCPFQPSPPSVTAPGNSRVLPDSAPPFVRALHRQFDNSCRSFARNLSGVDGGIPTRRSRACIEQRTLKIQYPTPKLGRREAGGEGAQFLVLGRRVAAALSCWLLVGRWLELSARSLCLRIAVAGDCR